MSKKLELLNYPGRLWIWTPGPFFLHYDLDVRGSWGIGDRSPAFPVIFHHDDEWSRIPGMRRGILLPYFYLRRAARTKAAEQSGKSSFPMRLEFLSRSHGAPAHAFTISLEMLGEELPEPLGQEFPDFCSTSRTWGRGAG